MKTNLLIVIFLVVAASLHSQTMENTQPVPNNYFIQKSKNQRETGFVLLGMGTAAFAIPIIIYASDPEFDPTEISSPVGPLSILIGAVMIVSSVPIFISAGNNKRKGMSLSFKNERTLNIQNGGLLSESVPSLSLKIIL
jgi:hypothetical protein